VIVTGITPVDDITIGITCAAFCFNIALISFAHIIIIIIITRILNNNPVIQTGSHLRTAINLHYRVIQFAPHTARHYGYAAPDKLRPAEVNTNFGN
jgi:hypothetical protein